MLLLALTGCLPTLPVAEAAHEQPGPSLVVLVVLDQYALSLHEEMRGSYTAGLGRFEGDSAWIGTGRYPYACTWTGPGHATLATGRLPAEHGVAANRWYQDDAPAVVDAHGPEQFLAANPPISTTADAVVAQGGRAVALSMKERGARFLGGSHPTLTGWLGPDDALEVGGEPSAQASFGVDRSGPPASWTWSLFTPRADLRGADVSAWEPRGVGSITFPHSAPGDLGPLYAPTAGTWLTALATRAVGTLGLGSHERPDLLTLSFSEVDYVGHRFTPESWEAQDNLRVLDRDLGALFATLDSRYGPDGKPLRYAVLLTADHGVLPTPAAMMSGWDVAERAEAALSAAGIPGAVTWLDPGLTLTGVAASRHDEAVRVVMDAARSADNVGIVAPGSGPIAASTPYRDEIDHCRVAGRAADVLVWPRWGVGVMDEDHVDRGARPTHPPNIEATGHGTPYAYDREVPILAFGAGISAHPRPGAGDDQTAAYYDMRRIAPTLASLADVPGVGDLAGAPLPLGARN